MLNLNLKLKYRSPNPNTPQYKVYKIHNGIEDWKVKASILSAVTQGTYYKVATVLEHLILLIMQQYYLLCVRADSAYVSLCCNPTLSIPDNSIINLKLSIALCYDITITDLHPTLLNDMHSWYLLVHLCSSNIYT